MVSPCLLTLLFLRLLYDLQYSGTGVRKVYIMLNKGSLSLSLFSLTDVPVSGRQKCTFVLVFLGKGHSTLSRTTLRHQGTWSSCPKDFDTYVFPGSLYDHLYHGTGSHTHHLRSVVFLQCVFPDHRVTDGTRTHPFSSD